MAVSQPDGSLLRAHNGWSVSLLPGYMTSPSSLFFTRLGGIWTQFHGNVNETAGANMDSYNKTVPGWLLGFGYETAITEVLSVTLEYDYSIYQEYQTDGVIGNTNYSTKYDITSNAFNIGLNYRF
jgi:opacity protein-like surface antigen